MSTRSRLLFAVLVVIAGGVKAIPVAAQNTSEGEVVESSIASPAEDNFAGDDFIGPNEDGLNPAELAALGGAGGGGDGEAFLSEDGYVWHSNGGADATYPGDGSSRWRYNPTGDDIVVDRFGTGRYSVDIGSAVAVLPIVTAYDASGSHCKISSYGFPGQFVNVACFSPSGEPVDEEFTLRWTSTLEDAYTFVDINGDVCCQNSWGAPITAVKTGIGSYTVTTPGGPVFEGGHVQVTAYGTSSDACRVEGWSATTADIACFDTSGAPSDSPFTFLRIGSEDDAFVWADNSLATTPYTTEAFWSHNPQGNDPTSVKTAVGSYTVTIPGLLNSYGGNVQVTAYGGAANCSTSGWGDTSVLVRCFDAVGNLADSQFNVLFTRFQTCNGLPANVEIGNNVPTSGDDVIIGTTGDDSIFALAGNDTVCGLAGDDFIVGGPGDDFIYGDGGDDTISGNAGDDTVYAGSGDDTAFAGSGNDYIVGGSGDDLLGGSSGFDEVFGEGDDDRINGGSDGDGRVDGGSGDDAVNGGGGDDVHVTGGTGNDAVSGNGGDDVITGAAGQDEVRGGPGDDQVFGGAGDDFLAGNDGTDTCDGEGGVDIAAANCEVLVSIP